MSQMYEAAQDAFAAPDANESTGTGLSDVTVMMVDDEPMMIEVTQAYLEDAGYRRFVAVIDPRLALATARVKKPGLILLDLIMPGMNGFEVLRQIRQEEGLRYTPVIVLTAASDPASKLRALELGATEFLAKPVDESELKIRVRNSLAFKVYQDRLANDDPLTGLLNRRAFMERLRQAMSFVQVRRGRHMALLHINLDRFRQVNESLGHQAGDALLVGVGERLREVATNGLGLILSLPGRTPLLARLGADEFALLLPDVDGPEPAATLADEVLAELSRPFHIEAQDLYITPSIGIAMHPGESRDEAGLMSNASVAMKHAKSGGRNAFHFYSQGLNGTSRERLNLETQLRRAMERHELVLHYQPKVDLESGRICGAEALMRWMHPQLGMVPPSRFIPIAEETGLIVDMGEWVVHEVCAQIETWRETHGLDLQVAVNVARHGLASGNLESAVSMAIRRHRVKPGQLVLELTESMLMDRVETIAEKLRALRALGAELSIDDFGTGYSSMSYLKQFPVQELKIDRSFVMGSADDRTDAAIVRALIVLGHSLGMRVVAEGVETEPQRATLSALGCDSYQGFLCSAALPPEEFVLKARSVNG
jgi:diguanylate cyclase (GGDEF)-like protein